MFENVDDGRLIHGYPISSPVSAKNQILTSIKGPNSIANLRKTKIYNTNSYLVTDNQGWDKYCPAGKFQWNMPENAGTANTSKITEVANTGIYE